MAGQTSNPKSIPGVARKLARRRTSACTGLIASTFDEGAGGPLIRLSLTGESHAELAPLNMATRLTQGGVLAWKLVLYKRMMDSNENDMKSASHDSVDVIAAILEKIHDPEFSLQMVLDTILDHLVRNTHAEMGTILAADSRADILRAVAIRGDMQDFVGGARYPTDKGIQAHVLRTGTPMLIRDTNHEPMYVACRQHVLSEIAVPIMSRGDVLGVINLESPHPNRFDQHQLEYVNRLAMLAANAFRLDRLRAMDEIARIEREILAKQTCFVLMPFSEPFNKYYRTILVRAIESAGLSALRADTLYGPAKVMEDIMEGIKKSRCLIAELTTRNPNVMYELGIAHAMHKPVVLLTQNIEDVPFDLRSIRCIVYDTTDPDWSNQLVEQIGRHLHALIHQEKRTRRFKPFA